MGSTWNASLVRAIGRVIGTEARVGGATRAFSPELQVRVCHVFRSLRLRCLFSLLVAMLAPPQVDTNPRFGRTEEAFGEDPKLVADMG